MIDNTQQQPLDIWKDLPDLNAHFPSDEIDFKAVFRAVEFTVNKFHHRTYTYLQTLICIQAIYRCLEKFLHEMMLEWDGEEIKNWGEALLEVWSVIDKAATTLIRDDDLEETKLHFLDIFDGFTTILMRLEKDEIIRFDAATGYVTVVQQ